MKGLIPYIQVARPDHWFKNIFMLPGVGVAALVSTDAIAVDSTLMVSLLIGFASTCLIASANYCINEYLDAEFDKHHPVKKNRPAVLGLVTGRGIVAEYLLLSIVGLLLAWTIGLFFLLASVFLLIMGLFYNVQPIRTKDRPFLDVVSESINNPIRFILGWSILIPDVFPPTSILLAYWFGGAFLMAIKRFAEYRRLGDDETVARYRVSLSRYSEDTLLLSSFFYALNASFFLAIFLIKYRIEFVLSFPLFALLFSWYLAIGLRENSVTQTPEKLYQEKPFLIFVGLLVLVVSVLFLVDIPWLHVLLKGYDVLTIPYQ